MMYLRHVNDKPEVLLTVKYTNDPIECICQMQPYTGIRVHGLATVHEKVWGFTLNHVPLNVENCFSVKIARKLL